MVTYKSINKENWLLTEEGKLFCKNGSHEFVVYEIVRKNQGITLPELQVSQTYYLYLQ